MSSKLYLDYAAATPVDNDVVAKMNKYFSEKFYNPSAIYLDAKVVAKDLEKAREKVAKTLGVRPAEIIFTAGGTEANNLAINGVMAIHTDANVVISSIEHDSVIKPSEKYSHKIVGVDEIGIIQLKDLRRKIDDKTVLVSVMYANNEIGTVQPIRKVAKIIIEVRKQRLSEGNDLPLNLHVDACQAPNYLDLHANRLGADLMTINGGKIYGPKQSGALYVRSGVKLDAQILGGGQESGMRSGTENVANIIGLSEAIELVQKDYKKESERLSALRDYFIEQFKAQFGDKATINGSVKNRLPNNVNVTFLGVDNERLVMELDEKGIMCAVGSACSASNDVPSHVLKSIGLTDEEAASTIRFTMGRATTKKDITRTIKELVNLRVVKG